LLIETAKLNCEVVVDLMTNATAKLYGASPEGLCIIQNSVILYQSGPGSHKYTSKNFENKLSKLVNMKTKF